jgi:phospholipid-transporting ATPase
VYKN